MDDTKIIALYESRDEAAVAETQKKYGGLCRYIAEQILQSREDAEECVNDAYHKAWNTIPPQRPTAFRTFLCRITRNLSIDRLRYLHREKVQEKEYL